MPTSDEHSFPVAEEAVSDETAQMVSAATGGRIQAREVPAPMLSEDVPADLVDDAVDAWHETAGLMLLDDQMRAIIAAVHGEIEKQVRVRIAEEIEDEWDGTGGHPFERAAEIARGGLS